MLRWRIYYDDYSTYSNLDGSWRDAPSDGVICIVVHDPTGIWGRWIYSGYAPGDIKNDNSFNMVNEFFVKYDDDEEPFATWEITPFLERMRLLKKASKMSKIKRANFLRKSGLIKFGRQCNQNKWNDIMLIAGNDPDFPIGSPRRRKKDFPVP